MEIWGGTRNTSPGEMKRNRQTEREREKKEADEEEEDKVIEHHTQTQPLEEENTVAVI